MSHIDHIFLYVILYISLITSDLVIRSKIDKKFQPLVLLFPMLIYILVEGSRYGRGVDYFGYGSRYIMGIDVGQPVFDWLNSVFRTLDPLTLKPYGLCFVFYALIFISCLLFLYTKEFRYNTKFFLLFACLSTLYITEWTIRQGVSFSFFLAALFYLNCKKIIPFTVLSLIVLLIHYGNFILIAVVIFSYYILNKRPIPIIISIPAVLLSMYVLSKGTMLSYVESMISSLNLSALGGNFQGYVDNSEMWFSKDAMNEEWGRGTFAQVLTCLFYIGLFIVGYYYHSQKTSYVYIYNASVIGIIFNEMFHFVGSLARAFAPIASLWFIPLSLFLYYRKSVAKRKICNIAFLLVCMYLIMYYGRYVFMNTTANYVWNL